MLKKLFFDSNKMITSKPKPRKNKSKRGYSYNRPTYITLSEFMRIQNEINPVNAAYENRKEYDKKLQNLSQSKAQNWSDSLEMKKKNEFEMAKKRFLEDEMRRRKIDEEERKYQSVQNDMVIQRAKKMLFDEQDPVKTFNSKMMYCDMLKEREFQDEIKARKNEINKIIEKQFLEMNKKKMEDFDKKEQEKKEIENQKRLERMKIINDQLQESKLRIIQDFQEKEVEGQLMKIQMQRALEEDKIKEKERERFKQEQRQQFIDANIKLEKLKEEQRLKDLEEEKKIEEFAFKKAQLEDLRKKVEADKMREKQAIRQKMIDKQIEHLRSLQKNEDERIQKSILETEKKKAEEERIKKERRDKMIKEMEDQRNYVKAKREEERLKNKQDDLDYIDSWKQKMTQLLNAERQEILDRKKRDKDLADYNKLLFEEKKRKAQENFFKLTEDAYKTKQRLDMEDDDFIRYAESCIREYKRQGKNINPLLLELKRYKKDYSLQ